MAWIDYLLRVKALMFHRRAERELAEELRAHLEMETAYWMQRGLTREEAERAARVAFGGEDRAAEECRDQRGLRWLEDFAQDLRYAWRQLGKQKVFFAIAAGTLALGIGANTAMFSVVNGVLLRPLPYRDPDRLAAIWCTEISRGIPQMGCAWPDLGAITARNHSFESTAAYYYDDRNLAGDTPERVPVVVASAALFPLLGVQAELGRTFSQEEQAYGKDHVAILSDGLWRRRFGARRDVLGETIRLHGVAYNVIGVMPAEFQFPSRETQVWVPISFAPNDGMATRMNHFISSVARMKPGVKIEQARVEVQSIARQLEREFAENAGLGADATSYLHSVVGDVRPALLILLGAVTVVLLIACVNVSNLLLARASARRRELSIRTALGAGRARLVRQLLAESLLLGGLGGVAGVALSAGLVRLVRIFGPADIPRLSSIEIDPQVLLFTAGMTFLSAMVFGLVPAMEAARLEVSETLKEGGRSLAGGRRTARSRDALVVAEIMLSLVLVVGAGLLLRATDRLEHVDPGFRTDHLLTMSVALPHSVYPESQPEKRVRFYDELMRRLERIPGVKAAGGSTAMPIADLGGWGKYFTVDEHPAARLADVPFIQYSEVTPHYLEALGVPLKEGRFFTKDDAGGRPLVAVINESARRRYFPNESPIGKKVYPNPPEATVADRLQGRNVRFPRLTVVGVIGDVRQYGLGRPPRPELLVPHMQGTEDQEAVSDLFLMIRTDTEPLRFVEAARVAVHSLDPDQPVADVATMDQRLAVSLESQRFQLFLFGVFAVVALVLAAVGVYGVMSYAVRLRMHEIGIRIALGAGRGDVLRMVVAHGLRLGLAGIAAGLVVAYGAAHLMTSLLFGVPPHDAVTLVGAAVVLLAVIAIASFVPSVRAARMDALSVLRTE